MSKPSEKLKSLDQIRFDLGGVVSECLRQDDLYGCGIDALSSQKGSWYFSLERDAGSIIAGIKDVDMLQISPECLSMLYKKFLNENV